MGKSFEEYAKSAQEQKQKRFIDALAFGKSEAKTDSGRDFVESCEDFYKRKGYLTAKQIEALFLVDADSVDFRDNDPEMDDAEELDFHEKFEY